MAANELFEIDTEKVSRELLPPAKRSTTQRTWLISLLKPIQTLLTDMFDVFRPLKIQETNYNSQKIVFEKILSDQLSIFAAPFVLIETNPQDTNGIFLTNGDDNAFVMSDSENFLDDYLGIEYNVVTNPDFTVLVPNLVFLTISQEALDEFNATIDKFKIAPMTHNVIGY